jgi:adenine phosphoribosyltransferase
VSDVSPVVPIYAQRIRDVPDFPKPGIIFKDITPVLGDGASLKALLHDLATPWQGLGITKVLGIEARGFLLAPGVAERLGCGVVLARKPGKLPWTTHRAEYALEYGTDSLEMHVDSVGPSDRVLVVDDVLATGGTARAALSLVLASKAHCAGVAFVIELGFLNGRATLGSLTATSLLTY